MAVDFRQRYVNGLSSGWMLYVCRKPTTLPSSTNACLNGILRYATKQIHTQNWKIAAYSWSNSTHTAGVLILIRQGLASALAPKLATPQHTCTRGRFTDCILHWGGHRLHICNIYLPPGTTSMAAETRRQLFENALAATTTQAMEDNRDTTLIWAGDFNFVENPEWDSSAGRDGRQADRPITEMRQRAGPQMVDTHRYLHPRRRDFTHLYHAPTPGGSRLDRIYINEAKLPYLCHTAISFHTASDHRLATLHLLPCKNEVKGPGIKRIRMAFTDHEDLATSMAEWIRNQCQEAPSVEENPGNLIAWWPGFKRRLTFLAHQLNKVAQQRRQQPGAHTQEAYLGVQQAQQALDTMPHSPHLLQQLIDAQARLARVHIEDNARVAKKTRVHWLHAGERPGPALTTFLQTQIQDQQTAPVALQAHSGRLVTNPAQLPQVVADFWAGVCRAPDFTTPEDRQSVLTQLAAANIRLPEEADEVAGSPTIAVTELGFALKKSQPGKAPGWDGIPTDLYRKFWPEIGHTMAALFTAIGKTGQVPTGFLDGIIKVLYKKGDPKQPGNYRPITLLCSDYRLLAKVLANRLGPALGRIISPEQSAFLPKRLIGASVLFLRHLPHLLRKLNRQGLLAFLDFAKAYDTVDRNFLMGAMEAMGAGPQLCSWTRILLSNTRARAMVNGFKSRLVKMEAGVRQGCPLAPLLYLFVAQALFSWLKSQEIGLRLLPSDEDRVTACQFADDAEVALEGEESVPAFLEAMDTFARASGQRLNLDKMEILPIGAVDDHHQGSTINGLKVVTTATALNLPMDNQLQPPQPDWPEMLALAYTRMQRLAHYPLSAFGRAAAVSNYCLQTVTWHMEHGGPPPDTTLTYIERLAARLVDRKQGPEDQGQRFTGVPSRLLVGHPSTGGFGLLPLRQHIRARQAMWAVRFIRGALMARRERERVMLLDTAMNTVAEEEEEPVTSGNVRSLHPWIRTLATYLEITHPAFKPWALTTAQATGPWLGGETLPEDISRIVGALGHLPPLEDVSNPPLAPGDWCWAAALWGNPLLPNNSDNGGSINGNNHRPGLETRHPLMASCRKLLTVGDLVRVYDMLEHDQIPLPQYMTWLDWTQQFLDPSASPTQLRDKESTRMALSALCNDISPAWIAAARKVVNRLQPQQPDRVEDRMQQQMPAPPDRTTVMAMIVRRLGWRLPGDSGIVPLYNLTVSQATQLQGVSTAEERLELLSAFVQEAQGMPTDGPAPPCPVTNLQRFQATLDRLWTAVRWENKNKETLWRLVVDGIPIPGNTHLSRVPIKPCGCGSYGADTDQPCSPRLHHFWECPIAKAVREQIDRHLPLPTSATIEGGLTRQQLWLVQAPPGCEQAPWDVIALAALSSMEYGRHCLRAATREHRPQWPSTHRRRQQQQTHTAEQGPRQRAITDFFNRSGGFPQEEEEDANTHPIISTTQPAMDTPTQTATSPLDRAQARTVADFWARLHSFAALGIPHYGWDQVGPQHPILAIVGTQMRCADPVDITNHGAARTEQGL
ncbi:hypothetical protein VaNZ11_015193 [Volvox africanus]|uniref:Reverse transcriptase domain-containing protein n=1 Tax=Volvox africanus TaxID=51714 RepID=A0ABQ5SMQ9_9CHLO|nr:hypothetical protein VaNZ11_015193 [Volvox africanus]